MSSKPDPAISPEEYLEAERRSETKSEYFAGRVYAMTGASLPHNSIVANLVATIHAQLSGGPCRVLPSDMRLKVTATGLYTYPDVTIVRGEAKLEDDYKDTLLNPTVLIEVLSDSTERYDRGRKAEHYRRIESLAELLLISQHEPRVERYRRHGETDWLLTDARGLDDRLEIAAAGCALTLADVYDGVF